jgi:hypothetical protein
VCCLEVCVGETATGEDVSDVDGTGDARERHAAALQVKFVVVWWGGAPHVERTAETSRRRMRSSCL